MLYRGEEVYFINSGGIYNATDNYIQTHYSLSWEDYNGDLSDIITKFLQLSRGLMDAIIEFSIYSEEDYTYTIIGWKVADEYQKNYIAEELIKRAASQAEIIERDEVRQRALYEELALKYGPQEVTV